MAAWSARAGANRESDGSDTPVPLVADGTAAEAAKSISLAMDDGEMVALSQSQRLESIYASSKGIQTHTHTQSKINKVLSFIVR